MGLARRITRGGGERTAIKELRSSQYPQLGLSTSIIPDAVNTSVVGTEVIAIRVNSTYKPCIINSDYFASTGRRAYSYINFKKSENGFGITWNNAFERTSNLAWACAITTAYQPIPEENLSSVTFVFSGNVNNNKFPVATQYSDSSLTINFSTNRFGIGMGYPIQNFKYKGEGNPFGYDQLFFSNNFKNTFIKGNLITQGKNNYQEFVNSRNDKSSNIPFQGVPATGFPSIAYFQPRFLCRPNGVEPYVKLIYSQSNTNQNANATWLANQKTQYQRKFNRLKNLGI